MRKKQFAKKHKVNIVLIGLVILALLSIGGTIALILTNTEPKINTFIPGNISCEVQEDYSIKNTGNANSYIRADVIVNWVNEDENGNVSVNAILPEYTITLGSDWKQSETDGYYYYTKEVAKEENTTKLISEITTANEAPEGYSLSITVLAEAIQSEETNKAIKDAWGIDESDLMSN